jgi:hypothetical protein
MKKISICCKHAIPWIASHIIHCFRKQICASHNGASLEAGTKYCELGVDMMYFCEIYEEKLYIQVCEKRKKKIIRISVSHVKKVEIFYYCAAIYLVISVQLDTFIVLYQIHTN